MSTHTTSSNDDGDDDGDDEWNDPPSAHQDQRGASGDGEGDESEGDNTPPLAAFGVVTVLAAIPMTAVTIPASVVFGPPSVETWIALCLFWGVGMSSIYLG